MGTAPGPTPTPLPPDGSRSSQLIAGELGVYFSDIQPIANYLAGWSAAFESDWDGSLSPTQQIQHLVVLGTRVAQACSAIAAVGDAPPEAMGFSALLREAARVRHAWVNAALDEIDCCGTAITDEIATGNGETSAIVASLAGESLDLIEEYDADRIPVREFADLASGIGLAAHSGWLIASGLNPVLYAPVELNRSGIDGLGPGRWKQGTAVRVRRLRNPEPTDAETSSERFTALVTQQGPVASVSEVTVAGVPAIRHVLEPEDPQWQATVTVLVSGDFTYFIETGCPANVDGACQSTAIVADSFRILP